MSVDPSITDLVLHFLDQQVDVSLPSLQTVIAEITVETTINAASTLTLSMIDPEWELQRSGALDVDDSGLLPRIELNFPIDSRSWWRLSMVQGTTDLTSPNLTLTFVDRIVAYLRDNYGPKTIRPGSTTRAQFVKQLIDEANNGVTGPDATIRMVIPSINVVQPVEPPSITG